MLARSRLALRLLSDGGLVPADVQPRFAAIGALAGTITICCITSSGIRGTDVACALLQIDTAQHEASLRRELEASRFLDALSAQQAGHAEATAAVAAAVRATAAASRSALCCHRNLPFTCSLSYEFRQCSIPDACMPMSWLDECRRDALEQEASDCREQRKGRAARLTAQQQAVAASQARGTQARADELRQAF